MSIAFSIIYYFNEIFEGLLLNQPTPYGKKIRSKMKRTVKTETVYN